MSNLSTFIREHSERILLDWEAFARALPSGGSMNVSALRDHAQAMLDAIADDLDTSQTPHQQSEKAKGIDETGSRVPPTAAAAHGSGRAASGFTVVQMVAEFRALRASVIRLWTAHEQQLGPAEVDDLIRFNEAIDQAVAESLGRFSSEIDETRERFLAILGHDLRNPLGAIAMSTTFLLETGGSPSEQADLIRGIDKASRRMSRLVSDLLDLALTRLGDSMPISRAPADVGTVIREVVAEVCASYPNARIESHLSGKLSGDWDAARLAQAFANLLGNAVQHGDAAAPISIDAHGEANAVIVAIHNAGPAIPAAKLGRIFDGLKREASQNRDRRHLGLGLFIVDKIVEAHEGTIEVHSTAESGTTFTIHLPKSASKA